MDLNQLTSNSVDKKKCSYLKKVTVVLNKQGRKRPLDTPKRMIERRQREGEREKER